MDPIKANRMSLEAEQHKQAKVNSVIPQVSLTGTQFKETSICDVSSQLMKQQTINIQENTTTINEVLILGAISSYRIPTKKFCFNRCSLWGLWRHSKIKQNMHFKNDFTVKQRFKDLSLCLFILCIITRLTVSIWCPWYLQLKFNLIPQITPNPCQIHSTFSEKPNNW